MTTTQKKGPAPGKKYNETGKRTEVILLRTVKRAGYETAEELVAALKQMFEVEKVSFRIASERTGLGRDALRRWIKDNNITLPTHSESIISGVMDKFGTTNALRDETVLAKQKQGMKDWWAKRKGENHAK